MQPMMQTYTMTANAVRDSYILQRIQEARTRNDKYIKAREYYDGLQDSQLTERTRQFLNISKDADFNANYCKMVVNAKADRLKVTGFAVADDPTQSELFWKWWKKARMDRKQGIVHTTSIRDADSYLLVEWDNVANLPRFSHELAGTENGVTVYYSDEYRDEIAFATKHWVINLGEQAGKMRRLNVYFPDRIEKYQSNDDVAIGTWRPYEDDDTELGEGKLGTAGIVWWTDTRKEGGNPLGIPVVHFKNADVGECYGTGDLEDVMPLQDALNKSLIDLIAAMDTEGFGLLVGYGADWSGVKVGAGAIASVNVTPDKAKLDRLASGSPDALLATYNSLVLEICRVSGTPVSYVQASGQVAAEGTMKQQETALLAKVEKAQTDFGNAWEDAMIIARRLYNVFGRANNEPVLDEDADIDTLWKQAELRNDKEQAETLAIKVDKLGVSEEQAQREMDYDETSIAQMKREVMRKQAMQMRNMSMTQVQPMTQTTSASDTQAMQQNMSRTENGRVDENPPPQ